MGARALTQLSATLWKTSDITTLTGPEEVARSSATAAVQAASISLTHVLVYSRQNAASA